MRRARRADETADLGEQNHIATESDERVLHPAGGATAINAFNETVERYDPDLILSERGDSLLFPTCCRSPGAKAAIVARP